MDSVVSPPRVSVVTPVYNRAASLALAMRSIGIERVPQAELIIVDDGSTDGSADAARREIEALGVSGRARVISTPNGGPGAARNRGVAEASGEFVAFLDSDDAWRPWTLRAVLDILDVHPRAPLLFLPIAARRAVGESRPASYEPPDVEVYADFVAGHNARDGRFGTCNAVVRRDAFLATGGFCEAIRCREDTDLFLRLGGPCLVCRAPVMVDFTNVGDDRITNQFPRVLEGLRFILSAHRDGRYADRPADGGDMETFLAAAVATTIGRAFGSGPVRDGYALYGRHFGLLRRKAGWRRCARMALTPALGLLFPRRYRFRASAVASDASAH